MGYQMRTIQKISKTRSGSVKHIYLPLLPSRTPDINLHSEYVVAGVRIEYVVIVGCIDYHTGRYKWRREFNFMSRKDAEKTRDKYFEYMWVPDRNGLIINTVAIVKRFRR